MYGRGTQFIYLLLNGAKILVKPRFVSLQRGFQIAFDPMCVCMPMSNACTKFGAFLTNSNNVTLSCPTNTFELTHNHFHITCSRENATMRCNAYFTCMKNVHGVSSSKLLVST